MIINKYKLKIVDGYIKGFTNDLSQEGSLWEGQASQYNKVVDGYEVGLAFGCYKLVNNEIVYDQAKCHSIIVELEAEKREREKEEAKPEAQLLYVSMMTGYLLPDDE